MRPSYTTPTALPSYSWLKLSLVLIGVLAASLFFAVSAQAASIGNNTLPVVTGVAQEGRTLTTSNGTWKTTAALTYTYQWQRCDAAGASCISISGATGSAYTIQAGDIGKTLRSRVTAKDAKGNTGTATSAATAVVTAAPPVLKQAPKIWIADGSSMRVGSYVQTNKGEWTSSVVFTVAVQWLRCDTAGNNCAPITGGDVPGTANTSPEKTCGPARACYQLTAADAGKTLRVRATATNSGGSTVAISSIGPNAACASCPLGSVKSNTTSGVVGSGGSLASPEPTLAQPLQATVISPNGGAVSITIGDPTLVPPSYQTWVGPEATITAPDASYANPLVLIFRYDASVVPAGVNENLALYRNGVEIPPCYGFDSYDENGNLLASFQRPDPCVDSRSLLSDGDAEISVLTSKASVYNAASPPVNLTAPTISGSALVGQTLTATAGTWDSTAAPAPTSYTYQWQRCNSSGASCVNVGTATNTAATSNNRIVASADAGFTLRISVIARNANGASPAVFSAPTAVVTVAPPTNTVAPTVSGSATEGSTLTSTTGTWTGGTITYTRQWQRCNQDGVTCSNITGATATNYAVVAADVGFRLRVVVFATNSGGTSQKASTATATVGPAVPVNTAAPTLSGTAQEGQTLSTSNGTWTGAQITFSYKWQRCDAAGANCADISGATSASYLVQAADIDKRLRSLVTATNSAGSAAKESAASAVVLPSPPVNTALPVLSGDAREGATMQVSNGTFTSSAAVSYAYQWLRCDAAGASCTAIAGATAADYQLTETEVAGTVRAQVTATNSGGSSSATSAASAVATPLAPSNTSAPQISGEAREGSTLSVSNGTWTKSPTSFSYQWQRCDLAGANCAAISGATSSSRQLTSADLHSRLKATVTASNSGGSTAASSAPSAEVLPLAPSGGSVSVSGAAREGQTLSATAAGWTSSETIDYSYQWQRESESGFTAISGATSASYVVQAADIDKKLRVVLTAANSGGSNSATSTSSDTVLPAPPVNTALPVLSGDAREGATMQVSNGTFTSSAAVSYAYQWLRCDAAGASCAPIAGATAADYQLTSADLHSRLKATVTASNSGGATAASSAASAEVLPLAPSGGSVSVSGAAREGQTLSATASGWTSSETVDYSYQWQRCDSAGANCADIAGAASASYVVQSADIDKKLRVVLTAANSGGSASATSTASDTVLPLAPSGGSVSVSGAAREGATLSATASGWTSSTAIDYSYQWQRSSESGFTNIAGSTSASYVVQAADIDKKLRVVLTAANSGGSNSATSTASDTVLPLAPSGGSVSVSGAAREGQTLSATASGWTSSTAIDYSYQWQRCDSAGANCADIAGSTSASYVVQAADIDKKLRVVLTAANSGGSASATSTASDTVLPAPPVATAQPQITGNAQEGETLSVSNGSFTSSAPLAYTYQWQRSDGAGGFNDIAGATAASYLLTDSDVGREIRARVTATNDGGSDSAFAVATATVVPLAPINTGSPALSGTAQEGSTLSVSNGTWAKNPTSFSYQWLRCDLAGQNCSAIAGETASDYTIAEGDVDGTLRAQVTATNAGGSTAAQSNASAVAAPLAPANLTAPEISGQAREGATLTASQGSWTKNPTSFSYQWSRCDLAGGNCADISGAAGSTYDAAVADIGSTLRVRVTATNSGGSTPADSASTSEVLPLAPVAGTVTISGEAREGATLAAEANGFQSSTALTYTYQWQRSDGAGGFADIAGATAASYAIQIADIGFSLRVQATATNAGGQASAQATSATVLPLAPANTAAPALSGTARDGETLSVTTGSWSSSPTQYAYQWQRSTESGYEDIASADQASYEVQVADIGSTLRVRVTASNAGGSAAAFSNVSSAVEASAPIFISAPEISGEAREGETLASSTGVFQSPTALSYAYQWQRSSGSSYENIAGADQASYVAQAADIGQTLRVHVTASNAGGSAAADSNPTAAVLPKAPVLNAGGGPVITGGAQEGQALQVSNGDFQSSAPLSYAYQWFRCAADGNACNAITGADQAGYIVGAADIDSTLKARVTASNSGGSASADSAPTSLVVEAAPTLSQSPSISGLAREGETLTATNGQWTGAPSFSLQWLRCDVDGANCAPIAGATASSYELVAADVGQRIRVAVTATNNGGSLTTNSGATDAVVAAPPANSAAPFVMYTSPLEPGNELTVNNGTWTNAASYTYQWQRCQVDNCVAISGATAQSYTATTDELGLSLRALVTASGPGGATTVATAQTEAVQESQRPQLTDPPFVTSSGPFEKGQLLTTTNGLWLGASPMNFTYQWQRCDGLGQNCADIAGAVAQTYRLTTTDVGQTVRSSVSASNTFGSAAEAGFSDVTPVIADGNVPEPIDGVTISGSLVEGQELTANEGTWTNNPSSFAYQWQRCYQGECAEIATANDQQYLLSSTDVGYQIRVAVYASNTGGSGFDLSPLYGPVDAKPATSPISTAPPTIDRDVLLGAWDVMTASSGTWTNVDGATVYSFQWQRSPDGSSWANVSGATGQSFTIRPQDLGYYFRVRETARNVDDSSSSAFSAATSQVEASGGFPNVTPPVVTPNAGIKVADQLSGTEGTWSGQPDLAYTFTYQWLRCEATGLNCSPIAGATAETYTLVAADVTKTIRLRVKGTDSFGNFGTARSDATAVVADNAPTTGTGNTINDPIELPANPAVGTDFGPISTTGFVSDPNAPDPMADAWGSASKGKHAGWYSLPANYTGELTLNTVGSHDLLGGDFYGQLAAYVIRDGATPPYEYDDLVLLDLGDPDNGIMFDYGSGYETDANGNWLAGMQLPSNRNATWKDRSQDRHFVVEAGKTYLIQIKGGAGYGDDYEQSPDLRININYYQVKAYVTNGFLGTEDGRLGSGYVAIDGNYVQNDTIYFKKGTPVDLAAKYYDFYAYYGPPGSRQSDDNLYSLGITSYSRPLGVDTYTSIGCPAVSEVAVSNNTGTASCAYAPSGDTIITARWIHRFDLSGFVGDSLLGGLTSCPADSFGGFTRVTCQNDYSLQSDGRYPQADPHQNMWNPNGDGTSWLQSCTGIVFSCQGSVNGRWELVYGGTLGETRAPGVYRFPQGSTTGYAVYTLAPGESMGNRWIKGDTLVIETFPAQGDGRYYSKLVMMNGNSSGAELTNTDTFSYGGLYWADGTSNVLVTYGAESRIHTAELNAGGWPGIYKITLP